MKEKQFTLFVLTIALGLTIVLGRCSPVPAPSEAMSAAPETVVESFYNWYIGYPGNALVDGAYRSSEYLTTEFVRKVDEIIASFDKGGYDPFLCAQDMPGEFIVEKAVVSGEKASVVVHEVWNPGTQYELNHNVTVVLRMAGGQWKVSDIICPKVGAGEAEGRRQPDVFKFQGSWLMGMAYGFYELRVNGRQLSHVCSVPRTGDRSKFGDKERRPQQLVARCLDFAHSLWCSSGFTKFRTITPHRRLALNPKCVYNIKPGLVQLWIMWRLRAT